MTEALSRLTAALADSYTIERELGRGGMAVVYLAHDLKHDRKVAVKVVHSELTAVIGAERFLNEITVTANLQHPHILPLFDSGEAGGLLYYVMPYVEGESLRALLDRKKQLPIDRALEITKAVASALDHAHRHGVIHRDIKPENILLADDGQALVADFGIALAVTEAGGTRLTETGMSLGTPEYMSPEQATGDRQLDPASDIYSLGAVLYEMLGGDPPFTGSSAQAILARKSLEPVPSLHTVRETVPSGVEQIILRALARAPADRFATAQQFAQSLEAGAATSPPTLNAARRRRGIRVTVTAAAVAGAALGVGYWTGAGSSPVTPQIASLVVLPFDNLSEDPEQEYFVVGMHEAVIGELAQIGALKVTSRTTAMEYRHTEMSILEIARELKVDAIVTGGVLRVEDRVRITLELIDGREDRNLWTDSYQRDLRDVLVLQAEVAQAVAREIQVALSPAERHRLGLTEDHASTHSPDREAYDAYLKGRFHSARRDEESLRTAIRYYEEAIAKDSTFARPYAALAVAWIWPPFTDPERVGVAARKAVALDPLLPEAQAALGIARMAEWDWTGSEAAFQRAIDLNPNSSVAHQWYALLLRVTLRLDRALSEARRAAELDPLSLTVQNMVGWVLWNQRRDDEAIEVWDGVLELEPEYGLAIYNKGLAYAMQGNGEAVISAAEEARSRVAGPGPTMLLSVGYALSGQRHRAEEMLRELEARYGAIAPGPIAILHHILGDDDKALDWLEEGYQLRPIWLPLITSEPWFDDLREHPRFRELRVRMGLH